MMTSDNSKVTTPNPPQGAVLDAAYLARLNFAARPERLRRLIATFEAASDRQLQGLERTMATDDHEAYAQWLHDLRASSLNLGALRLKQACTQAETATDRVARRQHLADIQRAIQQTRAALLDYERSLGGQAE